MLKKIIYAVLLLLPVTGFCQQGLLDSSFNSDGWLRNTFGGGSDEANAVLVQSDGKILLGGKAPSGINNNYAFARYNADGTTDNTFSGDCKVSYDFQSNQEIIMAMAQQPDGRIVAVGSATNQFALLRLKDDGTPDSSFSGDGFATMPFFNMGAGATAVVLQPDGKIVAAGSAQQFNWGSAIGVVRYLPNGQPDSTFNHTGKFTWTSPYQNADSKIHKMLLQPDGKILMAGEGDSGFALWRIDSTGNLDSTFGVNGYSSNVYHPGSVHGLAYYNGFIMAGANTNSWSNTFGFARYFDNGAIDSSYGLNGFAEVQGYQAVLTDMVMQSDGKIIGAGFIQSPASKDILVFRIKTDGTMDSTFGTNGNGRVVTDMGTNASPTYDLGRAICLQPDTKIIVAGSSNNDFCALRYLNDGTSDIPVTSAPVQQISVYPNPFTQQALVQCTLPPGSKNARLLVHDMLGAERNSYKLTDAGQQQINIQADNLSSGIYFYSLVVDGKILATRKMVVE